MIDWGRDAGAAAARPGLVIAAADDPFTGGAAMAERQGKALGARSRSSTGWGTGGCCRTPKVGAAVLERFWSSVA